MSSSLTRTGPCSAERESADFPTLDVDVGADFRAQSAAAKRVCIATSEINGVVGSGGIGTAYYHLARHLAEWGHDVVIAYVNEKAADKRLMEDARALYARFDIAFEPIAPRRFGDSVREQVSASTMTLLDWVRARERPFDIVHVSERRGLGYGLLLAKSLGMAFGSTHFVVKGSSPLLWLAEANRRFLSSEYELGVVFMEKRSVELADTVICDSARLLEWMHGAGYAIPARSFVWPDPPRIADPSPAEAAERVSCDGALEVWEHWHAQAAHFEAAAERFSERERTAGTGMPLVTVCIVHYERPELVRMAVDSVLAQDYSAVEAVLVDDGSEGAEARATLDALEPDFLRRGWRLIRQENRYLGAARNAAAAAARGEWLLFLDDDNVLFPDAVSRLVRAARFSGADCITAASIRFSGKGDPRLDTRSHRHAPIRFFGAAIASNLFHNVIGDACALVRRSAFEAAGGFAEVYGLALEDMEFFNRLSLAGHRVEYMPDTTFYKRVLPASMIRSSDRSSARHRHFVTMPYLSGLSAEERALASIAIGSIDQSGVPKRLAESAMRRGNWAAARELWEELRQAFPDDSSGYVRGTVALLGAGCLEEAECLAVEALERFPDHSGAHVQRAEVAMRREDWAVASAMWADLREVFPYHTSGYVRGATALLGAGRLEEAEKLAVEAVSRFPDRPGGYAQHAEVAMRHEDWEAACDRWREVHEMFPDHAAGYVRGAEALLAAGRLEEAEALAVEAVSRFPEHVGGYVQRAEVAMRREDWAVARRCGQTFAKSFPTTRQGMCAARRPCWGQVGWRRPRSWRSRRCRAFPTGPGGTLSTPRSQCAMRTGRQLATGGVRFTRCSPITQRAMCAGRRRFWRQVGGRRRRGWRVRRWSAFPSTSGGMCSVPRWRCGVRTGRWRSGIGRRCAGRFPTRRRGMCAGRRRFWRRVEWRRRRLWRRTRWGGSRSVPGATFVGRSWRCAARIGRWRLGIGRRCARGFPTRRRGMCAGRRRFWRRVGGRRRRFWRVRRCHAFPSASGGTCSGPRWRCAVRTGRWRSGIGRRYAKRFRMRHRAMSVARSR